MSLLVLALTSRILSVQAGEMDVKIELVPETTLVVQGKHLLGEAGDTVKVKPEAYTVIQVPCAWDMAVSSEAGNISVECLGGSGPYPGSVIITTSVGNFYLKNPFPTNLTYTSMTGNVDIYGSPVQGDWSNSEYNLQTASGKVNISCPVNGVVWVNTLTGSVEIELSKQLPQRGSYDVRTGTGNITFITPDTSFKDNISFQEANFSLKARRIGMGEYKEQSWFWSWGKLWSPDVLIDYNRVSALHLGLGMSISVGPKPSHTASVGASYAFGQNAIFWHSNIKPRLVANPNIFVDFNIFDTISTYDSWAMSRPENAVAALVFKEDSRNYFRLKGASFGLDAQISQQLSVGAAYQATRVYSLSKTTDFSLLGPDSFRDNPQVDTGVLRGLAAKADYENPGLRFSGEFFKSVADSFGINQIKTTLIASRKGWSYLLLARLCLGYSFEDYGGINNPFEFRLGGIGTVPAYPQGFATGSHALLFNGEYHMKLNNMGPLRRLIAFIDAGTAWDNALSTDSLMLDLGAGLSVYGISLRIAQNITDLGQSPALFMRLEQRF